jgi:tetratricopeptide (TPR) repeat protein
LQDAGSWAKFYVIGIVIAVKICMRPYLENRSILTLLFSFTLLVLPYYLNATTSPPNNGLMSRIISITTKESKYGTTVNVLGNGKVSDYSTINLNFPPRIVVDVFNAAASFESVTIPVKSPNLKGIRIGYYPERIRLVLDIKGADIPIFTTMPANNGITIFLRSRKQIDKEKGKSNQKTLSSDKELPALEKLIKIEADDGQNDTAYFLKGVNAYRDQNWSGAVENLNHLIETYPAGRYTERAYFLLAKSYEQLYSHSISANFTGIKSHYEDAINRFPTSIYVPGALLAIGNLCFNTKNYYEALAYYNLVVKKYKDSIEAVRALMQKVKLFLNSCMR